MPTRRWSASVSVVVLGAGGRDAGRWLSPVLVYVLCVGGCALCGWMCSVRVDVLCVGGKLGRPTVLRLDEMNPCYQAYLSTQSLFNQKRDPTCKQGPHVPVFISTSFLHEA